MRVVVVAALMLAAVAFACGGYIIAKADIGQWLLARAWQRTQSTGNANKPWPWADMHPVARLFAPAQRADVIVLSGATGRTLAWGPGHLDGSARAGDAGNAVFTAHRDTHFAFLRDVRIGERIIVEHVDGSRVQFRVTGTSIVATDALHLRAQTEAPTLTLVTCYPFDAIAPNTRWRYVVSATLIAPPLMAMGGGQPRRSLSTSTTPAAHSAVATGVATNIASSAAPMPPSPSAETSAQPATPPIPPQTAIANKLSQTERIVAFS